MAWGVAGSQGPGTGWVEAKAAAVEDTELLLSHGGGGPQAGMWLMVPDLCPRDSCQVLVMCLPMGIELKQPVSVDSCREIMALLGPIAGLQGSWMLSGRVTTLVVTEGLWGLGCGPCG